MKRIERKYSGLNTDGTFDTSNETDQLTIRFDLSKMHPYISSAIHRYIRLIRVPILFQFELDHSQNNL